MSAAVTRALDRLRIGKFTRHLTTVVFGVVFLTLLVLIQKRLAEWNPRIPGYCYLTIGEMRDPGFKYNHPKDDTIATLVLGIWLVAWLHLLQLISICSYRADGSINSRAWTFLFDVLGILHFILYLLFAVSHRIANHGILHGKTENQWTFGQVVAVVMLVNTLLECVRGIDGRFCIIRFSTTFASFTDRF
jgi:hypothetical protein